jgi:hypothetical protein
MATSFDEIYGLNGAIMTDSKISNLPTNLYYFSLSKYLAFSIGSFRKKCYKDLDNRTEFSQEIYEFTGNGTEDDFTLSPAPPTSCSFYITVNDVVTTAYAFDDLTNKITFTTPPVSNADIYIGAYVIGSFADDLDIGEKTILAEGMTIPFIEYNINMTKQLNQMIYGNSVGLHSQANHNKVNLEIKNEARRIFKQLMDEYTYTNSPTDLDGLVGD